jgi:TRAP-type C4-dicarboxylate transport system permease small subunit
LVGADPALSVNLHPYKYSMRVMGSFFKIIEWIQKKLKIIGAVCIVGMTFLTVVDVIGRFFRHPILGSVEIVGFMATLTVVSALPYTHKIKGHVGVEILVRLLSKRARAIIDICTGILSLCLFGIVTWRMTLYANTMRKSGEVSISLELPEYVIIYATAFCLLIFTLVIVQDIIHKIKVLKDK